MAEPKTRFRIGDLIHHKRYGYRGVIFDFDPKCEADEDWYHGNQSQPPRDQPWYHVLVHGRTHTTYVAESNLEADSAGEPINHPLLDRIFQGFDGSRYFQQNLN